VSTTSQLQSLLFGNLALARTFNAVARSSGQEAAGDKPGCCLLAELPL